MVSFDKFINNFKGLPEYLNKKGGEILIKRQKEIIELNNRQILFGRNIEGNVMQGGYSKPHAKARREKGLQTGFVDLYFSGKYVDSRRGKKATGGINIISDATYEKYLRGNFPNHVGLNKIDAELVSAMIEKEVSELIKKYLLRK